MATLVSALRFGLPYAPGYKTDIEQWIKAEYGTEVRIGALSAGWQGTGPALVLQQLEVLDSSYQPQLTVTGNRHSARFLAIVTHYETQCCSF